MADEPLTNIAHKLGSIEAKLELILNRLDGSDQHFQRVEERLRKLEQTDARMMGIGSVLLIVVPAAVATFFRLVFP